MVSIWVLMHSSHALAAKLSLPVDLSIENGDFKNCSVLVTKNGEVVGTFPGKPTLRIKLDFNSDYILTFSKPGYISKKIAVNTTVTTEREQQTFEPYKIGVKLFKQYEGINMVVYNQPVAKIKFNHTLDDFDYDVDYTKSILSQLQAVEQELEVRASEERRLIASGELPKEGIETNSASAERFARFPYANGGKEISNEAKPTIHSKYQINPKQNVADTAYINGGVDFNNPPNLNGGDDKKHSIGINEDGDKKKSLEGIKGANRAVGKLNSDSEQDRTNAMAGVDDFDKTKQGTIEPNATISYKNKVSDNGGVDVSESKLNLNLEGLFKTKELVVEPNRTITTIKINDGKNGVIYRKVLYNWGGLYYFKNLSHSIPENLFELGTGEK